MNNLKEYRLRALNYLLNNLKENKILRADYLIDEAIRRLNNLPSRPSGANPYERLFKLDHSSSSSLSSSSIKKEERLKEYKDISKLHISKKGIEIIKKYESYYSCTYVDPGTRGLPITGGYGSVILKGKPLKLGQCYSKEVWEEQLQKDLIRFENYVKRYVRVPLNINQFSALVSLIYNIGPGNFSSSTFLKRLNQKDYKGCADAMTWFNKGGSKSNGTFRIMKGLVKRRHTEKEFFLSTTLY